MYLRFRTDRPVPTSLVPGWSDQDPTPDEDRSDTDSLWPDWGDLVLPSSAGPEHEDQREGFLKQRCLWSGTGTACLGIGLGLGGACQGQQSADLEAPPWESSTTTTDETDTTEADTDTDTDSDTSTPEPTGPCEWEGEAADDGVLEVFEARTWVCGSSENMMLGYSGLGVGDVTGDGVGDVAIGAAITEHGPIVISGTSIGQVTIDDASVHFEGGLNEYRDEAYVFDSIDVDGDGIFDPLVSVYSDVPGYRIALGTLEGSVQLDELPGVWDISIEVGAAYVDDFDGDGQVDLLAGDFMAGYDSVHITATGSTYLVSGPITSLVSKDTATWTGLGPNADSEAGWPVTSPGDTDGDGLSDVLIGGSPDQRAWLVLGGATGEWSLDESDATIASDGSWADSAMGFTVTSIGDMNGDGLADYGVSDPYADPSATDSGEIWIVPGGKLGYITREDTLAVLEGEGRFSEVYLLPPKLGDVDGDGWPDLGVTQNPSSADPHGWLVFGPVTGTVVGSEADLRIEKDPSMGPTAVGIWPGGDVDGDGLADLLVVTPTARTLYPGAGAAFLFTGEQVVRELGR